MKALLAVEVEGAYANLALNRILEKYRPGKLDRAFATELTYGTLRTQNTLDWVLAQFVRRPLNSQTPVVRNILRLGAYQLMFMDRVPPSAACNEGSELARKHGHAGAVKFVNGVLRNVSRYVHDREGLAERLVREGLAVSETHYAPEGLKLEGFFSLGSLAAFREGLFQVQDESSMLAGRALSPAPGAFVIDSCSAPGGKATHLAQLMGDRGKLLAVDIHPHKLKLIKENNHRLGITIIEELAADAGDLPKDLHNRADFVLADVPCSGLGVLRRRPDARWRKSPEQIPELVRLQAAILESSSRCVKAGGVLVYCTCTITGEENLGQVNAFLTGHPEFEPEDLRPLLPLALDQGGTLAGGYIQILPHRHGMDGFFIARMRKKRIT